MKILKHLISTLAVTITLGAPTITHAQSPTTVRPLNTSLSIQDNTDDIDSALATDGSGTVLAIYRQGNQVGAIATVSISQSTDSGNTWAVVTSFPAVTGTIEDASIVYAGNATFVAIWLNRQSPTVIKVYTSRSLDNGHTWTDPQNIPMADPQSHVDLASNAVGTLVASLSGLRLTSHDFGQTWTESSPPVDHFLIIGIIRTPAPVTYADGQFLQAYSCLAQSPVCIMPGSIDCYFPYNRLATSTDGTLWSDKFITRPDYGTDEIVGDITSSGTIVAALKKADSASPANIRITTSNNNGDTWSAPAIVATVPAAIDAISLTPNTTDWILACSTSTPGFEIFRSTGSLDQFTLLKSSSDLKKPATSPALLPMGSGFVVTYDELDGPTKQREWDIRSAFISGNTFLVASLVSGIAYNAAPLPIIDAKLAIKLSFTTPDKDTLKFQGSIPVPAGFSPLGQEVQVDIGGIQRTFLMDAKGKATSGNDKLQFKIKEKNGIVEEQLAKIQVSLKNGNFTSTLQDEGITNEDSAAELSIKISITFGENTATLIKPIYYKAKAGKSGTAK